MDNFNIGKIFFGLKNTPLYLKKLVLNQTGKADNFSLQSDSGLPNASTTLNNVQQSIQNLQSLQNLYKMNNFGIQDRSIFIKNLLGLPQNLSEILQKAQNPNSPLNGGTLGLNLLNQDLIKNQKALAEIFGEINQINNPNVIANIQQNIQAKPDTVALLFSGMINLSSVSKIILENSKQAIATLLISITSATKQGMDSKQLHETLGIISSCIAMAESEIPEQNLKSLMLLYLPWLPLNEGVGFDLEIDTQNGENDSNNSKLTVLIQTKNFGNLKGVFTLTTTNSIDIYIICSDQFPKKLLLKKLQEESNSYAVNTTIDIEEIAPKKEENNEVAETKVNLSATNETNPYLLLMAHAFIRNTILIDNENIQISQEAES